ncbi:MAG: hypothetical protein LAO79_06090 [Acidobacteriia bacterium]|nr:hypothetical protein [Terriglobia bacterium]
MTQRFLASVGAAAVLLAVSAAAQTKAGPPDLQGFWTNATITTMERPAAFAAKPTITAEEAKQYAQKAEKELNAQDGQSDGPLIAAAGSSGTGGYNVLFVDRGSELAKVDGQYRTSLIVDPPDGKTPPMTPEARQRQQERFRRGGFNRYDSVKDRPTSERCLIGFGSTSGPPMMPVLYNNTYQIVQTPDAVMIMVEMVHDVRVVRLNGKHEPSNIKRWLGDSIGHYEGDTLVVDTTNFREDNAFRGASSEAHIIERFRRINATTILYRVTVDDPNTWTKPFTMEYPFSLTPGPVYEYACHEGNYAMPDILGGARKLESQSTKK